MHFSYKALFGSFHWLTVFRTTLRTPFRSSYILQPFSFSLSLSVCLSWFLVPCSLVVPRSSARLIHYDSSYFRQWNPLPSASVGLSLPFSPDNQKVSSSNAAHFSLDVQTPSFFALSTVPSIFAVTTAPFLPTFSFFVAVYLVSSRSSRFRAPSSFRSSFRLSVSASVSTFCLVFDPRDSVPPRWQSSSDSRPISISIIARELPASFGCGLRTVFEDVSASVTSNRSYLFRCLDLQRPPTISHLFATVFFPPRLSPSPSPFPPPSFPLCQVKPSSNQSLLVSRRDSKLSILRSTLTGKKHCTRTLSRCTVAKRGAIETANRRKYNLMKR